MKVYYVKEHAFFCPSYKKNDLQKKQNNDFHEFYASMDKFCDMNPERILFYHLNDFYLININSCVLGDRYEFIENLLQKSFESKKKKGKTTRSVHFDEKFNNLKQTAYKMGKYVTEINYIYSDSTGKDYCIESKIDFIEDFELSDKLNENYIKAKDKLTELGLEYLNTELYDLYDANYKSKKSDKEIINTVDSLIKQLNKKTNGNDKKSKQQRTSKTRI